MSDDWPPPVTDLWLVAATMGAPVATVNQDEAGRAVMLRIMAQRNHGPETTDRTYVLDLDEVVGLLSGLLGVANVAFGRSVLQAAMSDHLGVPEALRATSLAAVEHALDETLGSHREHPSPEWLHEDDEGLSIRDRD